MIDRASRVEAWAARDRQHTVLAADREIVDAAATLRVLIVDLLASNGGSDELYDACAILGRLVAARGGSPSFASAVIDDAAAAVETPAASWLAPARAAVAEGFAAALGERAHHDAMLAWEFPSCAVRLGEAAMAVAAGHPSEDDEELAAWAARVARAAALSGIRRAVVAGREKACEAVMEALGVVGVEARRGA